MTNLLRINTRSEHQDMMMMIRKPKRTGNGSLFVGMMQSWLMMAIDTPMLKILMSTIFLKC